MNKSELAVERVIAGKQAIKEFEYMRDMAELKALSDYSLEIPLTDVQFKRMKELFNKIYGELKNGNRKKV